MTRSESKRPSTTIRVYLGALFTLVTLLTGFVGFVAYSRVYGLGWLTVPLGVVLVLAATVKPSPGGDLDPRLIDPPTANPLLSDVFHQELPGG